MPRLLRLLVVLFVTLGIARVARADPSESLPAEVPIDRSTPRRTVEGFLAAARAGDDLRAAYALDLRGITPPERAARGAELARELALVLDRSVFLDPATLSDDPLGFPNDGALSDRVVELTVPTGPPIVLTLARVPAGQRAVWVFSRATVDHIPELFRLRGRGWIEDRLPDVLTRTALFGGAPWQWLALLVAGPLAWLLGLVLVWLAVVVSSRTPPRWDDELVARAGGAVRWLATFALMRAVLGGVGFADPALGLLGKALEVLIIVTAGVLASRLVHFLAWLVESRAESHSSPDDEFAVRNVQTQVRVLQRVVQALVFLVTAAIVLLQFSAVRSVGVSLLASAGIVGVIVGFAAQRPVAALLAGIQVSLTRPIRLGDQVFIEKEWGTVEEIRLTHVVVRIWDDRRLVVPMARFLDAPFENWTKNSSELLGTVFLHADFAVPIDAVRAELTKIVEATELWDGRVQTVQVTGMTDRVLEVRALVSAKDASALWSLRCLVRERLVAWLVEHEGGRYLPRLRHVGTPTDPAP